MEIKSLILTAILTVLIFGYVGFVKARTIDNSALIAQLKAEIAKLSAQLAELEAQQNSSQTWCHTFNANIGIGKKTGNPEISALVTALKKEGLISQDVNFIEYNNVLASAVTAFQEKYASEILTPSTLKRGTGYTGVATRAKLNSLYGCEKVSTSN
jgi:hypothetical protein